MTDPIRLASAARFTEHPPLTHQLAAWNWLQEQQAPAVMAQFAELFRADPIPTKPPLVPNIRRLQVPYFSQLDNQSGAGYRECFSSSCAMLAAYWGKVKTDDEYNAIRARYGDTTEGTAQIKALSSLGLRPTFITNGSALTLVNEINQGRPVAVGWLHKGTPAAPTGGGHWTVVIGYTPKAVIMNDPNGEADLVNGGYVNHTGGRGVSYSRRNWLRRWEVPAAGNGWAMLCAPA
jgi:hypothetical protein